MSPRYRPAGRVLLVSLLVFGGAVGCGDIEDVSLCARYTGFLEAGNAIRALDAEDLDAAEAQAVAEEYLAAVRTLQQVADGRYQVSLGALEEATSDVLRTLATIPDDAGDSVWIPLVVDDLERARDAAVTVTNRIAASCPAQVD